MAYYCNFQMNISTDCISINIKIFVVNNEFTLIAIIYNCFQRCFQGVKERYYVNIIYY